MYEKIISKNFISYLSDDRLLELKIPRLYRIISKYEEQHDKEKERKGNTQLNEFLIKCLDKYGQEASVLFSHFNFGETRRSIIDLLFKKYSKVIDISYIQVPIFESFYEIENEKKEKEILLKKSKESKIQKK